jgi:hypothetical protein
LPFVAASIAVCLADGRHGATHRWIVVRMNYKQSYPGLGGVLTTAVRETTFRSGAMASRLAQLTLVDFMFVGVAADHRRDAAAPEATLAVVRGHRVKRPRRQHQAFQ